MTKQKIVLVGGGGHSVACIDVIQSCNKYEILGYIDKIKSLDEEYRIPYLGDDNIIENYIDLAFFLICVGQINSSKVRVTLFDLLMSKSAKLITVISPNAYVSSYSEIGEGSIIMHGTIIQAGTTIGKNCIINDKSLIEHNTKIGDHVHISTGAILNGNVNIGSEVFIGSGSIIKNGIVIKDKALIGMGSVVIKDVNELQIVAGNPAKSIYK